MVRLHRLTSTNAFIAELSSVLQISQDGLAQSVVGGVPHLQGTWVHPQVAIHLAQWLSPKFAVLVIKMGIRMDVWQYPTTSTAIPFKAISCEHGKRALWIFFHVK
jgi:hypothetical protein